MRGTGFVGSSFALGAMAVVAFGAFAALFRDHTARPARASADPFVCEAARGWRATHEAAADLRVVGVEVAFHAGPDGFGAGPGEVIAPLAARLDGAEEVLDVRADPPPSRVLHVDGTTVVAWDYAGSVHRDMHFVAAALVRRAPAAHVDTPPHPTFETLPRAARDDARLKASALGDHALDRCKAFPAWALEAAGPPPYTDQLLRIVQRVRASVTPRDAGAKRSDDVCAALRTSTLSEHQAQVVAVMALRELGAPAYGLESAEEPHSLVATYVDGPGWIALDVMDPERGYTSGGPAFVAKVPLVGAFHGARDGFWYPAATAYRAWQGDPSPLSWTTWNDVEHAQTQDSTVTFDRPLAEACR